MAKMIVSAEKFANVRSVLLGDRADDAHVLDYLEPGKDDDVDATFIEELDVGMHRNNVVIVVDMGLGEFQSDWCDSDVEYNDELIHVDCDWYKGYVFCDRRIGYYWLIEDSVAEQVIAQLS